MVAIRKHAPADATAESLALLAGKIDSMDRRHGGALEGVRQDVAVLQEDVSSLKQGQVISSSRTQSLKIFPGWRGQISRALESRYG